MILRLHNSLHLTRGALRSLLVDVQRKTYLTIPNDMHDMLVRLNSTAQTKRALVRSYADEDQETVLDYVNWLFEREIIFECPPDLYERFPATPMDSDLAVLINASIIDVEFSEPLDLDTIAAEIDILGCPSVQLRDFNGTGQDTVRHLLKAWATSRVSKIYLFLKYSVNNLALLDEVLTNPRIMSVVLHSAPTTHLPVLDARVHVTSTEIQGPQDCGWIGPQYFPVNNRCLSMSKDKNTCLCNKVSISIDGQIRNCPSHTRTFGHISEVRLSQVIEQKNFQAPWLITKDEIEVCRDCEFRSICSDCRVYTNGNSMTGKPSKCSYDPYTCTYEDRQTDPPAVRAR